MFIFLVFFLSFFLFFEDDFYFVVACCLGGRRGVLLPSLSVAFSLFSTTKTKRGNSFLK